MQMYADVYRHSYTNTHTHTCVCVSAYSHLCTSVCVCICVHAPLSHYTHNQYTYNYINAHIHTGIKTSKYLPIYTHECLYSRHTIKPIRVPNKLLSQIIALEAADINVRFVLKYTCKTRSLNEQSRFPHLIVHELTFAHTHERARIHKHIRGRTRTHTHM